jgi:hypothetical protein
MKSDPGPPMTLGKAAAARVRLIVCARPASTRSSPIPQRWLLGMAPGPPFSVGASGWSARNAVAGRSIWL